MSYRRPLSNSLLLLLLLGAVASATYLALTFGAVFLFSAGFQQVLVERSPSLEPSLSDADRLSLVRKVIGSLRDGDQAELESVALSDRDKHHLKTVHVVIADVLHLKRIATVTFGLAVLGGVVLCWRELQSIPAWLGQLASATGWMLFALVALLTSVLFLSDDGVGTIRRYFFDGHRWILSDLSILTKVFSQHFATEFVRLYGAALVSVATVLLSTGYVVRLLGSRPRAPSSDWIPPPPITTASKSKRRRATR